jgi:Flp pilus assembly pilin Flp
MQALKRQVAMFMRSALTKYVLKFLREERGVTAIEYALIAAMVGTCLIGIGTSEYGFGLKTGFLSLETSFKNYAAF